MATRKPPQRKPADPEWEEDIKHDGIDAVPDAPENPAEDNPSPDPGESDMSRIDYEALLRAVEDLVEMTSTPEWQRRHAWIQRDIRRCADQLLVVEKPREVVALQQRVAAFRDFLRVLRQPVDEMTTFCREMPLFAGTFPKHASWNDALGRAELRDAAITKKK